MLFRNCRLITPWEEHRHGWLRIRGEHISALGHFRPPDVRREETVLELGGLLLAPGFIDIHCHGAGGGKALDEGVATMATINPARVVGAAWRMGSLEVGKDANLVVFDEGLNVTLTIVRGRPVHDPDGRCPAEGPHALGKEP